MAHNQINVEILSVEGQSGEPPENETGELTAYEEDLLGKDEILEVEPEGEDLMENTER